MPKKKSSSSDLGISGGKGDVPRNCFSKQFRDNYDEIDWHQKVNNSPGVYFERMEKQCDKLEIEVCNTSSPKKS